MTPATVASVALFEVTMLVVAMDRFTRSLTLKSSAPRNPPSLEIFVSAVLAHPKSLPQPSLLVEVLPESVQISHVSRQRALRCAHPHAESLS